MPTNGLGWGLDYWGVGPWGILPPDLGSFELESFFATSERTVRVTFTQAALVGTPLLAGAALNVRTWSLATNDTPTVNPIILGVREIEGSEGRQFELYTLRKLPRYPSTLTLSCATILSAASAPLAGVPLHVSTVVATPGLLTVLALGLTGLVVTKLDGTAKGGVIAAIARQQPKPLRFIGVGEGIDDLQPFKAREFVEALFGA